MTMKLTTHKRVGSGFDLDGRHYPSGSWVMQTSVMPYAIGLTPDEYLAWQRLPNDAARQERLEEPRT